MTGADLREDLSRALEKLNDKHSRLLDELYEVKRLRNLLHYLHDLEQHHHCTITPSLSCYSKGGVSQTGVKRNRTPSPAFSEEGEVYE